MFTETRLFLLLQADEKMRKDIETECAFDNQTKDEGDEIPSVRLQQKEVIEYGDVWTTMTTNEQRAKDSEINKLTCDTCRNKFTCDTCGKKYKRKENLIFHQQSAHGSGAACVCEICGKTVRQNNMARHRQKHIGPKHMCHVCGKGFSDKANYNRHLKIHINS